MWRALRGRRKQWPHVLGEVAGAAAKTHTSAEVVLGTSRTVEAAMADLSRHIEAFLKGVAA